MKMHFWRPLMWGVALLTMPVALSAQNAPTLAAQSPSDKTDLAVTYSATRANVLAGPNFWLQGGSLQVHSLVYRNIGVIGELAGMKRANVNSSGVSLDLVMYFAGARYSLRFKHSRTTLFGQLLGGQAFGSNSSFPVSGGSTPSQNAEVMKAGGGLNVWLSPRIAVRAFEADWMATHFNNSTNGLQNNMSLGAGIVIRLR